MKRFVNLILVLSLVVFSACEKKQEVKVAPGVHAVQVVSSIDAPNYTYLEVSENGNQYWMAVPQMKVEKGETLYYSKSMEMKNFKSPTLNRTFDTILFVEDISKTPIASTEQAAQAVESAHKSIYSSDREKISVEPLKGGKTVAQIYAEKNELAGKVVRIRGKVTKYNAGIMDRNWIHIQDGTETDSNFDLLVTSTDAAQLGQTIVVEGTVAINKDFGAGYSYKVMIENAKVISSNKAM